MHAGKKGMKWGVRKTPQNRATGTSTQVGQVASAGLYLGAKSRYKTEKGKELRNSAGRARLATAAFMGANMATLGYGMLKGSSSLLTGQSYVQKALKLGTDTSAVVATVQGVRAVNAEKKG